VQNVSIFTQTLLRTQNVDRTQFGISALISSEMLPDLISTAETAQTLELFMKSVSLPEGASLLPQHHGNIVPLATKHAMILGTPHAH
jgi:hypothetical protein